MNGFLTRSTPGFRRPRIRELLALKLTPIEFKLLATLLRHAGRLVTHDLLLKEFWGPKVEEDSQYSRVCIHHLRRKIEEDPSRPLRLLTELGVGYRLVAK